MLAVRMFQAAFLCNDCVMCLFYADFLDSSCPASFPSSVLLPRWSVRSCVDLAVSILPSLLLQPCCSDASLCLLLLSWCWPACCSLSVMPSSSLLVLAVWLLFASADALLDYTCLLCLLYDACVLPVLPSLVLCLALSLFCDFCCHGLSACFIVQWFNACLPCFNALPSPVRHPQPPAIWCCSLLCKWHSLSIQFCPVCHQSPLYALPAVDCATSCCMCGLGSAVFICLCYCFPSLLPHWLLLSYLLGCSSYSNAMCLSHLSSCCIDCYLTCFFVGCIQLLPASLMLCCLSLLLIAMSSSFCLALPSTSALLLCAWCGFACMNLFANALSCILLLATVCECLCDVTCALGCYLGSGHAAAACSSRLLFRALLLCMHVSCYCCCLSLCMLICRCLCVCSPLSLRCSPHWSLCAGPLAAVGLLINALPCCSCLLLYDAAATASYLLLCVSCLSLMPGFCCLSVPCCSCAHLLSCTVVASALASASSLLFLLISVPPCPLASAALCLYVPDACVACYASCACLPSLLLLMLLALPLCAPTVESLLLRPWLLCVGGGGAPASLLLCIYPAADLFLLCSLITCLPVVWLPLPNLLYMMLFYVLCSYAFWCILCSVHGLCWHMCMHASLSSDWYLIMQLTADDTAWNVMMLDAHSTVSMPACVLTDGITTYADWCCCLLLMPCWDSCLFCL